MWRVDNAKAMRWCWMDDQRSCGAVAGRTVRYGSLLPSPPPLCGRAAEVAQPSHTFPQVLLTLYVDARGMVEGVLAELVVVQCKWVCEVGG